MICSSNELHASHAPFARNFAAGFAFRAHFMSWYPTINALINFTLSTIFLFLTNQLHQLVSYFIYMLFSIGSESYITFVFREIQYTDETVLEKSQW